MSFRDPSSASFLLVTTTTLALLFLPSITLAAELQTDGFNLLESPYVSTLATLSRSDAISKSYTLTSFLSTIVSKSPLRTSPPSDEDQKIRYFQSGFTFDPVDELNLSMWQPVGVATWQDSILGEGSAEDVHDVVNGAMIVNWRDTREDSDENGGVMLTFVVNRTEADAKEKGRMYVCCLSGKWRRQMAED